MADQAGTTLRGYGHCPEYSEIFPLDRFNLGRSIPNRPRTAAEQVRPRWFGHDLSGAPDSGIGRTEDGKMRSGRVGRFGQSKFQPTIPQPIRRKRRAGGRVVTASDAGLDVRSEGAMWGTPCKRSLFGPEGQDSVSSVSDVEAQSGWPPDDENTEEAQSGWPPDDEYGYGSSRRSAISPQALGLVRVYVGTHVCGKD